jgi:hypothetical protein
LRAAEHYDRRVHVVLGKCHFGLEQLELQPHCRLQLGHNRAVSRSASTYEGERRILGHQTVFQLIHRHLSVSTTRRSIPGLGSLIESSTRWPIFGTSVFHLALPGAAASRLGTGHCRA